MAELLFLGEELGYESFPEFQVKFAGLTKRGSYMKGKIDAVWLVNGHPEFGFEVGFSQGKPRELAKLQYCTNGILVQAGGKTGIKSSNLARSNSFILPWLKVTGAYTKRIVGA